MTEPASPPSSLRAQAAENATWEAQVRETPSGGRESSSGENRRALAVFAPAIIAAVALFGHKTLPSTQSSLPTHPYPLLLESLLGAGVLLVIAGNLWPRLSRPALDRAPLLAGAIAALEIWDLVTLKLGWMRLPYFPGPDMVFQALIDDRAMLWESTWRSLVLLLCGYSLGVVAGLASGVLIGWFRVARYWGMPVMKVVGPIPATAYIPLVMTIFTSAFFSGSALIALAVWFPMTMLTSSGIANVPVSYLDVARTLGAGRGYLIFRVAVPAALPSIFLGLFMGLGASFLTLIVAETVGVRSGLGWYLKWQQGYLEYSKVYAALIIMAVFFSGLMTLLFKVRDRVLLWQKGVIRW